MNLGLAEKVALVTGSGRGIGRAIIMTLASEGVKAVVNDFYAERAESVANEINDAGGQAIAIQADLTKDEEVEMMVAKILDHWDRLDILVNNAGIPAGLLESRTKRGPFIETPRNEYDMWINLDFYGMLSCCRTALQPMAKQNWGRIVNIVSDAGRMGEPGQTIYSGCKAGTIGFSKSLAKEVARYKITVNCVAPSATWETYLSEKSGTANPQTEEQEKRQKAMFRLYPLARSMGRLGLPRDLANAVAYFVSDGAEWVTGQVLSVNGGYSMVD